VRGEQAARRVLEVAAAGSHNIFKTGPPHCPGKTMFAKRLASILALTFEEVLETIKICSVAGVPRRRKGLVTQRPFRSPDIPCPPLIGSAIVPRPGEVSLAQ
jgi:magnesium chelatase family protein